MKEEIIKSAFDIRWEIVDNFQSMTEVEMREALSNLCEAVKKEMIEQVENALYWMKDKKY